MNIYRYTLTCLFFLASIVIITSCKAQVIKKESVEQDANSVASRYIVHLLSTRHFLKPNFKYNNDLSKKIFSQYLLELDKDRKFLLQDDVVKIKPLKNMLDDAVRAGFLKPAYDIHKLVARKAIERYQFALNTLRQKKTTSVRQYFRTSRDRNTWLGTEEELNSYWVDYIAEQLISLKLAGLDDLAARSALSERFEQAIIEYGTFSEGQVFESFIAVVLNIIDSRSKYFAPNKIREEGMKAFASRGDVGLTLIKKKNSLLVSSIISGGPAANQPELILGSEILGVGVSINDIRTVAGRSVEDVSRSLAGEVNTDVYIRVKLPEEPLRIRDLKLTRTNVSRLESKVSYRVTDITLDGTVRKIAVVKVPSFYVDWVAKYRTKSKTYQSTVNDLKSILSKHGNIDGLIVDVRNNTGGALDECVGFVDMFINEGPVLQTKDYRGRLRSLDATVKGKVYDGPLIVLMNKETASGAEIFTQAMQDYKRGLVVGEKSFGAGTIQSLVDLDEFKGLTIPKNVSLGQLKFTTAVFYGLSGDRFEASGVSPDIVVPSIIMPASPTRKDSFIEIDEIPSITFSPDNRVVELLSTVREKSKIRLGTNKIYTDLLQLRTKLIDKHNNELGALSYEQRLKEQSLYQQMQQQYFEQGKKLNEFNGAGVLQDFQLQESLNIMRDYLKQGNTDRK